MSDQTPETPKRRAAGRPAGPPAADAPPAKATRKRATKAVAGSEPAEKPAKAPKAAKKPAVSVPVFQAPDAVAPAPAKRAKKAAAKPEAQPTSTGPAEPKPGPEGEGGESRSSRSRRRGRGRSRGKGSSGAGVESTTEVGSGDGEASEPDESGSRKRSRKRSGEGGESGSTRLDAKRQRRREGRDAGRRRAPILTEAEFLARRENVERVMVVRQAGSRTQIAVLEDGVLVEHYISQASSGSLVGNVYLGRVQNVLPGMEAAFVDIGKGRNAVLYAGEVNWDAAGMEGQPKKIEMALKSGDTVLVQVTKDPVGQKGARLTSQISLPGRFLVYVPNNPMTGISRKLPDRERARLKAVLKQVVPSDAGVIVRTAAEGASEDEISRDVARLAAQWHDIEVKSSSSSAPTLLYAEPDIAIKVVRDIFNEDVNKLVVAGDDAWDTVHNYVTYVAPDLAPRLEKHIGGDDVFVAHRIEEQLAKALDRKVYLPSGGSLVIDRTEAMTVVDVNTGKFIGQGGSLEQTVTKNNLEAAEEIVRQLRLRDIGGIIVIDFIDMVQESNRDLVIRRLIECLGRDRTKHQVAEVTSLGLVQMTRKRIGAGLLEVFGQQCDHCGGRGLTIHMDAAHPPKKADRDRKVKKGKAAAAATEDSPEDQLTSV